MKIKDVTIHNWTRPEWWDEVEKRPDEALIDATITLTLSWNDYQRLLKEGRDD